MGSLHYYFFLTIWWKPVDSKRIREEVLNNKPVFVCFYNIHPKEANGPVYYFRYSKFKQAALRYNVSCYWANVNNMNDDQRSFLTKYIEGYFLFGDDTPSGFFCVFFVPGKTEPLLMHDNDSYYLTIKRQLQNQD